MYALQGNGIDRAISIHASRVGGDNGKQYAENTTYISIHASRVGGDPSPCIRAGKRDDFNPRLPGGRRQRMRLPASTAVNFNPRLPGGRRQTE